jgi:general secretion pathway protein G
MNSRRRTRRGFTLVEILLVLGIIVMLAGVTAVVLWPQAKGARVDIAKTQMVKISKQLDLYNINIGHYPTEEETGLSALVTRPGFPDEKLNEKWHGPYLVTDDLRDPWGNLWQYQINIQAGSAATSGEQAPYKLSSNGPNGTQGDDDDIKNWSDNTGTP